MTTSIKSALVAACAAVSLQAGAQTMTPELLWKLGRVSLDDVSADGSKALYGVTTYSIEENKGNRDLYEITLKTGEVKRLTETPEIEGSAQYLQGGKKIGFSKDGHFWVMDADGTNAKQLTDFEKAGNYKAYDVDGGITLLFSKQVKMHAEITDRYPQLDKAEVKIFDDLMYRHWASFKSAYEDHLCMARISLDKEKQTDHKDFMPKATYSVPTPPFGGSDDFVLSPDGKNMVYVAKKMSGMAFALSTNTDLYLHNLESGKETNLTEDNPGYDNHPKYSPSGKYLAWISMARDGFESDVTRLKVRDMKTGKVYTLTPEEMYVNDFNWDGDNGIFANIHHKATQHVVHVKFDVSGKKEKITTSTITEGDYNYGTPTVAGKVLIAPRQDMNHAMELYTIDKKKGTATQLTKVNDEIYGSLKKSKVEKRMIKTSDGKDMLTWVIYPPNFDPNKKYPTLLYCQGGPQSPVSQFYSFRWNFQLMAAQGFIVVAPNRRGVPGFGSEWNEAISGDWGGQPMRDYLSAIDEMAKEPFVNEDALGAVGASYGGYSVYMLAGIHENRFKAFISHCGLFNMESWYGTTEELFFANWDIGGPYWEKPQPKAYTEYNPINFVDQWNTPILVIHGGKDFRVPENQGMEAYQAAKLRGVDAKFLYFPNEGHWVLKPQNGLIWHDQFFEWLNTYLR